jgi:sporulation integral membrane protein YtvI
LNLEYIYRFLRFLIVIAIIVGGGFALFFISKVTYPFIIAIFIAMLINPIVNFLETKAKFPRALAVLSTITLVFAFIAGLLTLLVAEIISGSTYLANVVPKKFEKLVQHLELFFADKIIPFYNQITNMFNRLETGQQATIINNIEQVGTNIGGSVSQMLKNILNGIPTLVAWLPDFATVIIFSLLATFFISKDWYKISGFAKKTIPSKAFDSSLSIVAQLKKAFFGFIKAQFTLISITAVIVLIGLLILRVDYAITIALIIGAVDILPYLGTGLVFVPWIVYLFFAKQYTLTIGLSILYIVVIIQRQVMEPKVLSSNIGLDPLATLVSLFVGFKLFGFLGLIIGPVTLVVLKTLHEAGVFKDIWSFIIGKKAA